MAYPLEQTLTRPHLVLVHSFPTNSILLSGLIDFLEDHFVVHFVDLPGFTRESPPVQNVSIEAYARFVRDRIVQLALPEYLLGGISFGFLVVNFLPPGPGCKAILAMEPFLGPSSMRMGPLARFWLRVVLGLIQFSGSEATIWKSRWFYRRVGGSKLPHRADTLLREMDARTFVATALMLLRWDKPVIFHDLPYVLSINPDDTTINPEFVKGIFSSGARELLVSPNSIDHYPDTISKAYFSERISGEEIERMKRFVGI